MAKINGLTEQELERLDPFQRVSLGLPVDRSAGPLTRFVENTPFLARQRFLRSLFGLDRSVEVEPSFDLDEFDSSQGTWTWYNHQLAFDLDRRNIYRLVEELDTFDLANSALSLWAEEATQPDMETGLTVWVEAENAKVKTEIESMFERIDLEENIYGIARSLGKYGDDFEQIIADEKDGVVGLQYVYPTRLTRIEDRFGRLRGFSPGVISPQELTNYEHLEKLAISKPWDFVNFSLRSSRRELRHGEPILSAALYSWRQLKIMEDALVLYRLNRAPDRLVYNIDTTGMSPDEKIRVISKWRRQLRKKVFYNPGTGQYRQEYNPYAPVDDIFWPKEKESSSGVEKLAGSSNHDDIFDVQHFRDKFFASVRVPKAFMGFDGEIDGRTALTQQDIRFARGVKRMRRAILRGVVQLARIHLSYRKMDPNNKDNAFTIRMSPIAMLEELQRSEVTSLRFEQADKLLDWVDKLQLQGTDKTSWAAHVLTHYMGFTDEEVAQFMRNQISGKQRPDGESSGGGSSSGGMDLGLDEPGGVPGGEDELPDFDVEGDEEKEPEPLVSSMPNKRGGELTERRSLEGVSYYRSSKRRAESELPKPIKIDDAGDPGVDREDVFDLNEELSRLDKTEDAAITQVEGSPCPVKKCHGHLRVVQVEDQGRSKSVTVCLDCGFAAELERSAHGNGKASNTSGNEVRQPVRSASDFGGGSNGQG